MIWKVSCCSFCIQIFTNPQKVHHEILECSFNGCVFGHRLLRSGIQVEGLNNPPKFLENIISIHEGILYLIILTPPSGLIGKLKLSFKDSNIPMNGEIPPSQLIVLRLEVHIHLLLLNLLQEYLLIEGPQSLRHHRHLVYCFGQNLLHAGNKDVSDWVA
jgi:hypothetical protein